MDLQSSVPCVLIKKGIAKETKMLENRKVKLRMFAYEKHSDKILVFSWIKNWEKNAVVFSTMYVNVNVTRNGPKKPVVHDLYIIQMVVLILSICYLLIMPQKTVKCWSINALNFILNTVLTNAKTSFSKSTSKVSLSLFKFKYHLPKVYIK